MSSAFDYRRLPALSDHLSAADFDAADAAVTMKPVLDEGLWTLRGDLSNAAFAEAIATSLSGLALPSKIGAMVKAAEIAAICVGPDEWTIAVQGRETHLALSKDAPHHSMVNITDQSAVIDLTGPKARDVLSKCIPLDLDPSLFPVGSSARTLASKAAVLLRYMDDSPRYRLVTRRSFSDYLWAWLMDASAEYL